MRQSLRLFRAQAAGRRSRRVFCKLVVFLGVIIFSGFQWTGFVAVGLAPMRVGQTVENIYDAATVAVELESQRRVQAGRLLAEAEMGEREYAEIYKGLNLHHVRTHDNTNLGVIRSELWKKH